MAISGFLFISWRIFEIVMTVPIVGMLSWIVHQFVKRNLLTPEFVLVMFIVSVLALAWALFTTLSYFRARHDAVFVALVDLAFFGAFIAGVVLLRRWGSASCGNVDLVFQENRIIYTVQDPSKWCNLLKASFALGIINVISFFVTFLLALLVAHHHRDDDRVVVKREYHSSRHGHRRDRPSSRDNYRGSSRGPARNSRGSQYSDRRRQYYV